MLGTLKKKINRIIAVTATKMEKTWKSEEDNISLHYILRRCRTSDTLVIVFSAANSEGPRYSYLTTMLPVKVNTLFIKDDIVPKGGNYYLGSGGKYNNERAVFRFIDYMIEKIQPEKLVFAGSSKGGYAAINFGINYPQANIIVSEPQYHLGKYMYETKKFNMGLSDILGTPFDEITQEQLDQLNDRLPQKVRNNRNVNGQRVFLQYTDKNVTYTNHVKDLISDLDRTGMKMILQEDHYEHHEDLRFYFPKFLTGNIKMIQQ